MAFGGGMSKGARSFGGRSNTKVFARPRKPATSGMDKNRGIAKNPTKVANVVKSTMNNINRLNTPANRTANMGRDTGQSAAEKAKYRYPTGSNNTNSGTRRSIGGGGGGTPTTVVPTVTTTTAPKPTTPVPTAPKPTPKPTPPKPKPQPKPVLVKGRGKGRAKKFKRRRPGGPISGLSITPEMLASIARQRIVNYR